MTISSNIVRRRNFMLSLLQFLKFFGNISDSFKLRKFQTYNTKAKTKDKKVNMAPNLT